MKKKYLHEYTLKQLLIEDVEVLEEDLKHRIESGLGKISAYVSTAFSGLTGGTIKTAQETQNDLKLQRLYKKCRFWEIMSERWLDDAGVTAGTSLLFPNKKAMRSIIEAYKNSDKHKNDPDIDLLDPEDDGLMDAAHLIAAMEFVNAHEIGEDFLSAVAELGGAGKSSTSQILGAITAIAGVGVLGAAIPAALPLLSTYLACAGAAAIFAADGADKIVDRYSEPIVKIVTDKILDVNFDGEVSPEEVESAHLVVASRTVMENTKDAFRDCWVKYEQWLIDKLIETPYSAPTLAESNTAMRDIYNEVFNPTLFALEVGELPSSYEDEPLHIKDYIDQNLKQSKVTGKPEQRKKRVKDAIDKKANRRKKKQERKRQEAAAEKIMKQIDQGLESGEWEA